MIKEGDIVEVQYENETYEAIVIHVFDSKVLSVRPLDWKSSMIITKDQILCKLEYNNYN